MPRDRPRWRAAALALLAAALARPAAAQPQAAPAGTQPPAAASIRILQPPPVQWERTMLTNRPALDQSAADFARMAGGIAFGMIPAEVNARLPDPYPGLSWSALPVAGEFTGEVRYFWARLDGAAPLLAGLDHCAGAGSTVVFLFTSRGLFRLSYRFLPDKACPDVSEAARDILARYVTLGRGVALSTRYRTRVTEVVDITDPAAGALLPVRYRQGGF
jgi:hypothetical protein